MGGENEPRDEYTINSELNVSITYFWDHEQEWWSLWISPDVHMLPMHYHAVSKLNLLLVLIPHWHSWNLPGETSIRDLLIARYWDLSRVPFGSLTTAVVSRVQAAILSQSSVLAEESQSERGRKSPEFVLALFDIIILSESEEDAESSGTTFITGLHSKFWHQGLLKSTKRLTAANTSIYTTTEH